MTGAAEYDDKWIGDRSPVTTEEKKKVIGKVLEIAFSMIFSQCLHLQRPDPDTGRKQQIGLYLSGEITRLEMADCPL